MHAVNLGAAVAAGLCLYFLPTIMAIARNRQRRVTVFFVNLFFGWTVIGWVAAMLSMAEQHKLDIEAARSWPVDQDTWSFDRSSGPRLERTDDWVLT